MGEEREAEDKRTKYKCWEGMKERTCKRLEFRWGEGVGWLDGRRIKIGG